MADNIPTFYNDLDMNQFEQFLTDEDYSRIQFFDNVYILPFFGRKSTASQTRFGFGLSRLMIRNLMLLHDISIHGPEDTAEVPCEAVPEMAETRAHSSYVTGFADNSSDEYSLKVELHRAGQAVRTTRVRDENFPAFIRKCSTAIARLLDCNVDESIVNMWDVGQPQNAKSLGRLGKIHVDFERRQMAERGLAARNLLADDPDFIVAMWDIDEELPGARQQFLAGLRRDPFNAQLYFMAFCTIWTSRGPQPEALQFCRKAIELSPGHGKAHMCAPHAAHHPVAMLRHSELGYLLLPGNSFAVNNYTNALTRANAPVATRIALAEEGIRTDPRDPSNYLRLIELCTGLGDHKTALRTAERLQKLFEPRIDERALYCLRQNPQRAKLIDSGAYNPAAENRQRILELRRLIRGEG